MIQYKNEIIKFQYTELTLVMLLMTTENSENEKMIFVLIYTLLIFILSINLDTSLLYLSVLLVVLLSKTD